MRTLLPLLLVPIAAFAMAGCGVSASGDGGPTRVRSGTESDVRADRVIATLGDSIVAGSPHWDPDPDVRGSLDGVDEDSQWQRWVDVDAELRNCGVWGERTDEIRRRFDDCTEGADAVVLQGGINDIVQGRPVAQAADDLACMAELARSRDLDVALVEVLPWNNGDAKAAASIRDLNRRIHAIAERGGVPVLPFHSELDDPDDHDRMPADRTVEGDHPNVAGYEHLGEKAWRMPEHASHAFSSDC